MPAEYIGFWPSIIGMENNCNQDQKNTEQFDSINSIQNNAMPEESFHEILSSSKEFMSKVLKIAFYSLAVSNDDPDK